MADTFSMYINGRPYTVNAAELPADYSLNDYIRDKALLKGTKVMCREGGCGACTVTVQHGQTTPYPVNSCLVPVNMCNGWKVTTVEGLGNEKTGYNKIQKALADNNGSQCGFCSPGMVMAMYGKVQQSPTKLPAELEGTFDGNICRCTGYRPIMHAMQQCATDIEDMARCHNCPNVPSTSAKTPKCSTADSVTWYHPGSLADLQALVAKHSKDKYYLANGHTAVGVYKYDGPYTVYIDIKAIDELSNITQTPDKLTMGACVTLTQLKETFNEMSATPGFAYLKDAHDYLDQVANLQIRNLGSWAGNLMMKNKHNSFVSDVFILLESIGARVTINDCVSNETLDVSVKDLLTLDMTGKVIEKMDLTSKDGWTLRCYKVMPRYKNAHSLLSLAFFVKLDDSMAVMEKPCVLYAGVSPSFVHADDVESLLQERKLTDNSTVQDCMSELDKIVCEGDDPLTPSADFRKSLLKSLFYKAVLSIAGSQCSSSVKSGGELLVRPDLSSGKQDYPTDPSQYPMTQATPKLDARKQTAGEAQFVGDIPHMAGQLHAVFVKATIGSGTISGIDKEAALQMPGVVNVFTSEDIPGKNIIVGSEIFLCENEVFYYGQPLAIVVADTERQAMAARDKVKVTYSNVKTPILNIEQAIKANSFHPDADPNSVTKGDAQGALKSCDLVVEGSISTGEQYPMHTETQTCLAEPHEGFYTLHAATQVMSQMQNSVSDLLGITRAEVEVKVRRVGGGFGAKQSRSTYAGNAAALAAFHTQRPVLVHLTLQDNMEILGRRQPMRIDYQAGVNKDMKVQAIMATVYENCGFNVTDAAEYSALLYIDNAYYVPNWDVKIRECKTNQPNHSYVRTPGILSTLHFIEQIMDEIARQLGEPIEKVKEANFYTKGQTTPFNTTVTPCYIEDLWTEVKTSSDYDKRVADIVTFNGANKWRKKAISLVPLKYGLVFWPNTYYLVHVGVNYGDGTVTLIHGGVELGQGINTKAVQVAAHTLGISVDQIKVQPPSTAYNINSAVTGGSITSDMNCLAVKNACDILNKRMAPYKTSGKSWMEVVSLCATEEVDLHAKFFVTDKMISSHPTTLTSTYDIYGAACAELELDVLTGNYIIHRMDVLYDCGFSYSPEIDIGQVEGAVVMALGLFFHEEIKYQPTTGQMLTDNTWTYHVPMNRDIPVDLRVSLLKNRPNPDFPLRSKIVAEPPMLLAESAVTSLRKCIAEVRLEQGASGPFSSDTPITVEKIHLQCDLDSSKFIVS